MTHAVNNHVVNGDRDRRIDELENHAEAGNESSELRMLRQEREREEEFRALEGVALRRGPPWVGRQEEVMQCGLGQRKNSGRLHPP